MQIRLAKLRDCTDILRLYAQYIDTAITFEYTLPSFSEFFDRMQDILEHYPYLAAVEDGKLLGYAYAHRAQERAAYQWNAELSIYLDRGCTGHGYGRALYSALLELLRLQGVRTAYGVVTMPNEKSEHLHLALGFRKSAVFPHSGYKNGAWHDVAWFEKEILPNTSPPSPVISFPEIAQTEDVKQILRAGTC